MTESSAITVPFLAEYEKTKERVNKSLRQYLGSPGTGETQNLRASVRRLDTALRVLPKKTGDEKAIRRCRERCRDVLRETSRIRDIDILRDRISKHPADKTVALMLANFQEEREEFVDASKKAAWRLFEHHPPKLERRDLPRFVRRVEGALGEMNDEIVTELAVSLKDEAKVDALHSLRKHCKRLRYTLELFPAVEHNASLVGELRGWQDVLGEIRDCDVIVDYLSRARPTAGVRSALTAERALRHKKYISFVKSSSKGWVGKPLRLAVRGVKVRRLRSGS
jgi:CHAD domain-containing protein